MPSGVYIRRNKKIFEQKVCSGCRTSIHRYNKSGFCLSCAKKNNPTRYWLGKHRPDHPILQKGRVASEETKSRLSKSHKGLVGYWKGKQRLEMRGANHANWKGGHVKHPDKVIRMSGEYKDWRRHVFQRDDYTCQSCGVRGGRLQADHELPFAIFKDLRFEILNGRTLCVDCHKKTPTYATKWKKLYEYS